MQFVSTYTHRIDRKGRVSVPAEYRDLLARQAQPGMLAYPAPIGPALRCAGLELIDKIAQNRSPTDLFSTADYDEQLELAAEIVRLSFDGEGRVQLPEALAQSAGIAFDAQVVFAGRLQYFEIWDPARFAADRARRIARRNGGGDARA